MYLYIYVAIHNYIKSKNTLYTQYRTVSFEDISENTEYDIFLKHDNI